MKRLQVSIRDKYYPNNLHVLDNLQFNANTGEFIAIVGPSGTGKTTLLNIIANLDSDFTGEIVMPSLSLNPEAKVNTGIMFQEARLMPWLTVAENIKLVMQPSGNPARELAEIINRVGLGGFESSFPAQLSGGMKRRVSMARAFAVDPQVLLLDEPFQHLDGPAAEELQNQLMQLWNKDKQLVLLITHQLREALALADRILFLSKRPATIMLDFPVKLKRPRTPDCVVVDALYYQIINKYPGLLSGELI